MAPGIFARVSAPGLAAVSALTLSSCYGIARDADEPTESGTPVAGDGDVDGAGASTTVPCVDDKPALLRGLAPAWPFDGAELREQLPRGAGYRVLAFEGSLCSGVADRAACVRDVQRMADTVTLLQPCSASGGIRGTCGLYIVATRGEEIELFVDRAGMLAFVGAVDTPTEALLVLAFDGREVRCSDEGTRATAARPAADGFEVALLEITRSCPVPVERVLLQVSRQGDVEEVGREPVMDDTPCGHP